MTTSAGRSPSWPTCAPPLRPSSGQRHRRPPDLTPSIRAWFATHGFDEVAFDTEPGAMFAVGTNRFAGRPLPWRPDRRLFTFVGDGADAHH